MSNYYIFLVKDQKPYEEQGKVVFYSLWAAENKAAELFQTSSVVIIPSIAYLLYSIEFGRYVFNFEDRVLERGVNKDYLRMVDYEPDECEIHRVVRMPMYPHVQTSTYPIFNQPKRSLWLRFFQWYKN